jgi:hypothetical protein
MFKDRLLAAVVGLLLGAAATAVALRQPEAQAQEATKGPAWEYKVVYSSASQAEAAKALTEQYNALAGDGWEYVGPVVERTAIKGPGLVGVDGTFVLFKRPRR